VIRLYWAGLVVVAWAMPLVAAVETVVAWTTNTGQQHAAQDVAAGLAAAATVWLVAGLVAIPVCAADTANRSSYDELNARLALLKQVAASGPPAPPAAPTAAQAVAATTVAEIEGLLKVPGLQWVLGYGYIDGWRRLHRCEQELLESADTHRLAEEVAFDRLRLLGSNIPNAKELGDQLTAAESALKAPPNATSPAPPAAIAAARAVRYAIDRFRDSRWEGMARIRNRSMTALLIAGTAGYLLLALALIYGAPGPAVGSALAFFLVAAIVGLISAIQTLSGLEAAVDDYALSSARLVGTPIVSGLCGLGGVLLVGLGAGLSATLAASAVVSGARTACCPVTMPPLTEILDAQGHPVQLAVAALFGVTPSLFLGRLNALVHQYNLGLASTEPSGTGSWGP